MKKVVLTSLLVIILLLNSGCFTDSPDTSSPAPADTHYKGAVYGISFNKYLLMSWDFNNTLDGYKVYIDDGSGDKLVTTSVIKISRIKIPNLINNKAYKITVKAVRGNDEWVFGTKVAACYSPSLIAPTSVFATAKDKSAFLTWSSVNGASSYNIYIKSDLIGYSDKITTSTLSYLVSSLQNGIQYSFSVSSVIDGKESLRSQEFSFTPKASFSYSLDFSAQNGGTTAKGDYLLTVNTSTSIGSIIYSVNSDKLNFSGYDSSGRIILSPEFYLPNNLIENYSKTKINKRTIDKTIYKAGDKKVFLTQSNIDNSFISIQMTCQYVGTKSIIWVENPEDVTVEGAKLLADEFDNVIAPLVNTNFGENSDFNGDGKIAILCYDIKDNFAEKGSYISGYFAPRDLYYDSDMKQYNSRSNEMELINIDTFPGMYRVSDGKIHPEDQFSTIVHEYQHMVEANENIELSLYNTWFNEGCSMAAQSLYSGEVLDDRIRGFNKLLGIKNGLSVFDWSGDLDSYSIDYLFIQYLKTQAGGNNSIFKSILRSRKTFSSQKYDAAYIMNQYLKNNIAGAPSIEDLLVNFRLALFLHESSGKYSLGSDTAFNDLTPQIYSGVNISIKGGGALLTEMKTGSASVISTTNTKYIGITK